MSSFRGGTVSRVFAYFLAACLCICRASISFLVLGIRHLNMQHRVMTELKRKTRMWWDRWGAHICVCVSVLKVWIYLKKFDNVWLSKNSENPICSYMLVINVVEKWHWLKLSNTLYQHGWPLRFTGFCLTMLTMITMILNRQTGRQTDTQTDWLTNC